MKNDEFFIISLFVVWHVFVFSSFLILCFFYIFLWCSIPPIIPLGNREVFQAFWLSGRFVLNEFDGIILFHSSFITEQTKYVYFRGIMFSINFAYGLFLVDDQDASNPSSFPPYSFYIRLWVWNSNMISFYQNTENQKSSIFNFYPSKIDPRKNLVWPTDAADQGASF